MIGPNPIHPQAIELLSPHRTATSPSNKRKPTEIRGKFPLITNNSL